MRAPILHFSLLSVICGCQVPSLQDDRQPTGSQTITASSDYSALYVANTDEGSITRLPVGGKPTITKLEGEPTRVARANNRVFVTLRALREVAVLEDDGSTLVEVDRIRVGHEPFGVVANESGTRVYVASSLSNSVQEIDATTLEILREFQVSHEPRWLALHPGNALYVAAAYGGYLFYIDLDSGRAVRTQLPQIQTRSFEPPFTQGVMAARITGDPAVSPDGKHLLIPTLYADTTTPIPEPEPGDEPQMDDVGGYANRFNPSVSIVKVDDIKPKTEEATIVPVQSSTFDRTVVGYPASVTVSPDGKLGLATIEGAGAIVVFGIEDDTEGVRFATGDVFIEGGQHFHFVPAVAFDAVRGVRGIAFVDDRRAYAYGFLERRVAELVIDGELLRNDFDPYPTPSLVRRIQVEESNLSPEIELGRELFYASGDDRMSLPGSGLSCATCHFDGRSDGFTWTFERGPRQTPSLAGKVSLTAPVRWQGDRETVAIDAMRTSQGLMGGRGLTENETLAIEAFIDSTRDVDTPKKGEDDPRILRGAEIFNRPDVGCATCHNGERYTDNRLYSMFGMERVKTRSLVGIAGSPPYLHDGSAATLRDVLIRARNGAMGNTSGLSEEELDDLVTYLESL